MEARFNFSFLPRLIKEKFKDIPIETTFQSRFGPEEWLTPYTDKTLEELPLKGKKKCTYDLSGLFIGLC